MIKLRVEAETLGELDDAVDALDRVFDVAEVSDPYPNRRGRGQRVYVEANANRASSTRTEGHS